MLEDIYVSKIANLLISFGQNHVNLLRLSVVNDILIHTSSHTAEQLTKRQTV